jgi:hypothetical protein
MFRRSFRLFQHRMKSLSSVVTDHCDANLETVSAVEFARGIHHSLHRGFTTWLNSLTPNRGCRNHFFGSALFRVRF